MEHFAMNILNVNIKCLLDYFRDVLWQGDILG